MRWVIARLGALREEGTQGFEGIAVGGGGSRDLGGIGNIAEVAAN
jgi:hypothetical protein